MSEFKITFQAGDIKSLSLKDISARRFVRLYENKHGVLQGTVNTGPVWGDYKGLEDYAARLLGKPVSEVTADEIDSAGEACRDAYLMRPEFAMYVLPEVGLTLFDPETSSEDGSGLFFLLAVIEYEIDGKVGYLLRVREVADDAGLTDPAFSKQYRIVKKGSENPADWRVEDTEASVAYALDRYLFMDDQADNSIVWTFPASEAREHAARIAEPTLAEYAE